MRENQLFLALATMLVVGVAPTWATVIDEFVAHDTHLAARADNVDSNFGDGTRTIVGGTTTSSDFQVPLYRWTLSSVPSGEVAITAGIATFNVFSSSFTNAVDQFAAYQINASNAGWIQGDGGAGSPNADGEATWNNLAHPGTPWTGGAGLGNNAGGAGYDPAFQTITYNSATMGAGGQVKVVVPKSILNQWIASPSGNAGFLMRQTTMDGTERLLQFHSLEGVGTSPQLAFQTVAGPLKSQTFNSDASASAAGWSSVNTTNGGNNFGFSNTNNTAGDVAGEAGGLFNRTQLQSYYADTDLGGAFTFEKAFTHAGEFTFTGRGSNYNTNGFDEFVAFFDKANSVRFGSQAGFQISEPNVGGGQSASDFRIFLTLADANGTAVDASTMSGSGPDVATSGGSVRFHLTEGVNYQWIFKYDPDAGPFGQATLQFLRLSDNDDRGTITADLTAGMRSTGAFMDAFGWTNDRFASLNETPDNNFTAFIDDLTYSVVPVPEPTSLALIAIAGMGIACCRRRSRNVSDR